MYSTRIAVFAKEHPSPRFQISVFTRNDHPPGWNQGESRWSSVSGHGVRGHGVSRWFTVFVFILLNANFFKYIFISNKFVTILSNDDRTYIDLVRSYKKILFRPVVSSFRRHLLHVVCKSPLTDRDVIFKPFLSFSGTFFF